MLAVRTLIDRWRTAVWPRRVVVLCCLALAGLSALAEPAAPAPTRDVAVVVARHFLAAGTVLRPRDLRVRRWPRALVPATAAHRGAEVLHRRVAGPVGAGEPITVTRLVGRSLAVGLSPGTVAVPLLVDAGHATDLIRVGDRIDVYAIRAAGALDPAPAREPPRRVAAGLRVLAVVPLADQVELVLETPGHDAPALAAAGSFETFPVVTSLP